MSRTTNLDQAIAALHTEILRKEEAIAPAREQLLALERARQILNGDTEATPPAGIAPAPFGRLPGGRKKSNGSDSPYLGFEAKKLKGLSIRQAVTELAMYSGGKLYTKWAGKPLVDAGLTSHKVNYKASLSAYGAAAHHPGFKKVDPGVFELVDKTLAASN